jgi:hypothetical protein
VSDEGPAQIVRFWQAVEIFSPQQLPKPSTKDHIRDIRPDEPMPWEPGSALPKPKPGKVWRHEVYCGVYSVRGVRDVLVQRFGDDSPEAPARGESALFACTVDSAGTLVDGSAVLSSCAWAIGQVLHGRSPFGSFEQDALAYADDIEKLASSGFSTGLKALAASLRDAVPDAVSGGIGAAVTAALGALGGPLAAAGGAAAGGLAGRLAKSAVGGSAGSDDNAADPPALLDVAAISGDDLRRFTAEIARRLGVADALNPRNVRVNSYQISIARAEEETGQPFLNSFFVEDLARVATAIRDRDAGTALTQYLSAGPRIDRIDVQQKPQSVRDGCAPEHIPAGRWVTDIDRPLAFSQQFAVNQIMRELSAGAGLFAVNGPPGTGKTTMLRDLIAAIVVRRATEIACLTSPAAAFTGPARRWDTPNFTHWIRTPAPALTGFEIAVASSNNGAVENVTTEIPGPTGIGSQWLAAAEQLDYFTATARRVHGDEAWAMIAARLGSFTNRHEFTKKFWWDRGDASMASVLNSAAPPDWQSAVTSFRRALARVHALSAERAVVSHAITRLPIAEREHGEISGALDMTTARYEEIGIRLVGAEREAGAAWVRREAAADALRVHAPGKPGPLAFVSGRGRAARQAWEEEHRELSRRFTDADREHHAADLAVRALRDQIRTAGNEAEAARVRLAKLAAEMERLRAALRRWSDHVPSGAEYAETQAPDLIEQREKSAPWADEEFTRARTGLFLEALALHKALIMHEARTVRKNLNALMDVLGGKGHPEPAATLALWQTFFLVVPVVSSTFASFGRLFAGCGRESIGWLLIDEAGQAAPQYAAGALWRSRRAVVVGDPLQLEPVVTLPWGGQQALLRQFGVSEDWAPSRTSAQQVADRLAVHGTLLPAAAPGEYVWVGTPLRVHRRCDRPMFDVSNTIAYNGLMVFGTPDRDPFYDHDAWHDIRSSVAEGHWIPAEGQALQSILTRLRWAGVPAGEIRVLSPFRKVAGEAARIHRAVFDEVSEKDRGKWVGTVHTMQGKEADVVIVVLGGDPGSPGSRRFGTESPNLLNVAVSRARRRLYVIGNRATWGKERFFDVLAAHVPPEPPSKPCKILVAGAWVDGLVLRWERGQDERWKGVVEYRNGAELIRETRDQDELRTAAPESS